MSATVDSFRHGEGTAISGAADLHVNDQRLARALRSALNDLDAARMHELASRAGMSRAAFAKRCSTELGVPAMRFVRAQRLRHAAQLLIQTSRPVKAIAAVAGYASRSQFCRAFQKQYGVSPSDFRRRKST